VKALILALAAALLLSACASEGITASERLELYRANAGEPVPSFRLVRNFRWTPLDEQAVAVWTGANSGYLLELRNRCTGLTFASDITISNSGDRVVARFDSVQQRGNFSTGQTAPCRIWTIHPLDARRLSDAKREMREAQTVEREPGVTEAQ
jgi:Family of unknown function (DUF6491)